MERIWKLVPAGVKRRLAMAAAASVLLPWTVGEAVKTMHQAGLDDDSVRSVQLIDFGVIGAVVFGLTTLFTVMLGCLIVASMKGPAEQADLFPGAVADHDPG